MLARMWLARFQEAISHLRMPLVRPARWTTGKDQVMEKDDIELNLGRRREDVREWMISRWLVVNRLALYRRCMASV